MTDTAQASIDAYRKRKQKGPFFIWAAAILLIAGGLTVLFIWLFSTDGPVQSMMATETPTPTNTATVTPTVTPSSTPTETPTPTASLTPTPSAPFEYEIQDGDNLFLLKERFELNDDFLCTIQLLNPSININTLFVGQRILLPNPGLLCPTATPIDLTTLSRNTKIQYTIQAGDTLASIAFQFNSTVEALQEENKITNPNNIFQGQVISVPVNLVTPVPTTIPTITPTP
jgi:LysM repeat protein